MAIYPLWRPVAFIFSHIIRPKRQVTAHWHCFLDPGSDLDGFLISVYQWIALRFVAHLTAVLTTSTCLASELKSSGVPRRRIFVLPCCLCQRQEQMGLALPFPVARSGDPLRVLFIGRLDSYKRLDWLLEALSQLSTPWKLAVVGDGPFRSRFERLAQRLFLEMLIHFLGGCLRLQNSSSWPLLISWYCLPIDVMRPLALFNLKQWLQVRSPWFRSSSIRHGVGWSPVRFAVTSPGLAEVLQRLGTNLPYVNSSQCRQGIVISLSLRVVCGFISCVSSAIWWKSNLVTLWSDGGPLGIRATSFLLRRIGLLCSN